MVHLKLQLAALSNGLQKTYFFKLSAWSDKLLTYIKIIQISLARPQKEMKLLNLSVWFK